MSGRSGSDKHVVPHTQRYTATAQVSSYYPISDWRYVSYGKQWGVDIKRGPVWLRLVSRPGPGNWLLFDAQEEIPPVMAAFTLCKPVRRRRHGR